MNPDAQQRACKMFLSSSYSLGIDCVPGSVLPSAPKDVSLETDGVFLLPSVERTERYVDNLVG